MYRNLKFLHMTDFFSTGLARWPATNMRYDWQSSQAIQTKKYFVFFARSYVWIQCSWPCFVRLLRLRLTQTCVSAIISQSCQLCIRPLYHYHQVLSHQDLRRIFLHFPLKITPWLILNLFYLAGGRGRWVRWDSEMIFET